MNSIDEDDDRPVNYFAIYLQPSRIPTRLKDRITAKVTFIDVVNNVTTTEEPSLQQPEGTGK